MGDLVNLNKARKARAKAQTRTVAEANRARFGRTKAQKQRDLAEAQRIDRAVDGAKLDSD